MSDTREVLCRRCGIAVDVCQCADFGPVEFRDGQAMEGDWPNLSGLADGFHFIDERGRTFGPASTAEAATAELAQRIASETAKQLRGDFPDWRGSWSKLHDVCDPNTYLLAALDAVDIELDLWSDAVQRDIFGPAIEAVEAVLRE